MKMVKYMYKKVYVEITNACNLSCDFCIQNQRPIHYMTIEEFQTVLSKLEGHTKYLYFHVLGEPCLHPKINELIDMASKEYQVNITTNGYLIQKIKDNENIRQLNISLHSYHERYGKTLEEYMRDILEVVDKISSTTYISFRFWQSTKDVQKIIQILEKHYNTQISVENIGNTTLAHNIFVNVSNPFIWPDLDREGDENTGFCYALKDHIGILSDGTVVPCCLDSKGSINLGNIFQTDLQSIQKSDRYKDLIKNFKDGKRTEKLCQNCNFMTKNTF